jgi:hypothetical protein
MTRVTASKDLRSLFGVTRHQRLRPTCLAFAASDTHAAVRGPWLPLSCEYVFYHAQQRASRPPTAGALLSAILAALEHDGQPAESGWPYLPALPSNPAKYRPPHNVGAIFRRSGSLAPALLDSIVAALDLDRPAIVLMTISRAFFLGGAMVDADSQEVPEPARRHAVIACGHGKVDDHRALLVRNSWGDSWGDRGYAWIAERYLAPRIFAIALLTP